MRGQILHIDTYENRGILQDEEGNEVPFSLDDCVGFDETPEELQIITYGINNGEIFFVEPFKEIQQDNTKNSHKNYIEEEISKDFLTPKDKRKRALELNIPVTVSIAQCIEEYFSDVTCNIDEEEVEFEEFEELNYPLMKRFLNTAYNNLSDMDSTFMDEELLAIKTDLNTLDHIFTKLIKKEKVPLLAFERVFLSRQVVYKTNKKRLEVNTSEIHTLKSTIRPLEERIRVLKSKIELNQETSERIEIYKKDIKRYNTYYVDSLHKMGTLKEENKQLQTSLNNFEEKHQGQFSKLFELESKKYNGILRRQLDGYAYVFDQMLWEKAETSNAIIAFFKKAHIEEEFSSKTFLKYFIKSLDEAKMSKELKKLQALLIYLESRAKMKALIVCDNLNDGDRIKHLIRKLDKEYSVETISKARSIYYRKDLKILDFIFVEYNLKNPPILEFLSMLQTRIKQTKSKAKICIVSKTVTKEILTNIKNLKLTNLISLGKSDRDLEQSLKELVAHE